MYFDLELMEGLYSKLIYRGQRCLTRIGSQLLIEIDFGTELVSLANRRRQEGG